MMSCSALPLYDPVGPDGPDGASGDGPPLGRIETVAGPRCRSIPPSELGVETTMSS